MASPTKIKALDRIFSQYIRLRDSNDMTNGRYFTCCSCWQMKPYEQADAGHFINRKWMATRWREDNVHAQCRACNRFDEGNAIGYARFMQKKYGDEHVDRLFAIKNMTQKWTDYELEFMIKDYKAQVKNLTNPSRGDTV